MRNNPYEPGSGWDKIRQARLEATKEYRAKVALLCKERYEFLKAHGICVQCGQEYALEGITLCAKCREKNNLARRGKKQRPLTAEQKARKNQNAKETRQNRIELGLCHICGKVKAVPGLKVCSDCRIARNQSRYGYFEHSHKWYEKERKAGRL